MGNSEKIIASNKKAFHDYHILEKFQAGIALTGTEIKSIRAGMVNLKDSFAKIEKSEVWLYKSHISKYEKGNIYNHEPERKRKLLLTKQEIAKLEVKLKGAGQTLVPLKLYLVNGWAKIEIGLAKGKKMYDKREDMAKKSAKREMERETKQRY
ncbi:MAG TPA: SsrA-binding protein SmpB [Candidatus Gastranaerophilales bacterium]|nr:SsrA-binding protein SmpB [Candidatus Gastranaerophilales bacterium]